MENKTYRVVIKVQSGLTFQTPSSVEMLSTLMCCKPVLKRWLYGNDNFDHSVLLYSIVESPLSLEGFKSVLNRSVLNMLNKSNFCSSLSYCLSVDVVEPSSVVHCL